MTYYLPDVLATAVFFPLGLFMGYMITYVQMLGTTKEYLYDLKYWPFCVGGVVAILTGTAHVLIKFRYNQYKYEHFYFLMIGGTAFIIAGGLMMGTIVETAACFGSVAHGIMYVTALSYINIRTGYSEHRYLKLSMPHFLYLFGISVSANAIWGNTFLWYGYDDWSKYDGTIFTGMLIMSLSIIFLFTIIANEMFHHSSNLNNYKKSFDNDVNRENTKKELFQKKYFVITSSDHIPDIPKGNEPSILKEFVFIIYALASKVLTLVFLYPLFVHMYIAASDNIYGNRNVFLIYWFGTAGSVISLILMTYIDHKTNYILTIIIKIVCMAVIYISSVFDVISSGYMKIPLWFVFMGLGFGMSHSDINILSYTNLRSNEIVLAFGYLIEHLIIGVLPYVIVFNNETIKYKELSGCKNVLFEALSFLVILTCIGIIGYFVVPRGKHCSLLEIKNKLNYCENSQLDLQR